MSEPTKDERYDILFGPRIVDGQHRTSALLGLLEAEGEENVSHQLRGVADDVPEHESPNPGDHRP